MTNPHNFHLSRARPRKKKVNEILQSKTKNMQMQLLVPKISQLTILVSCY